MIGSLNRGTFDLLDGSILEGSMAWSGDYMGILSGLTKSAEPPVQVFGNRDFINRLLKLPLRNYPEALLFGMHPLYVLPLGGCGAWYGSYLGILTETTMSVELLFRDLVQAPYKRDIHHMTGLLQYATGSLLYID